MFLLIQKRHSFMQPTMVGSITNQKIFISIVLFISVDMMNNFVPFKFSSQGLLRNFSVLPDCLILYFFAEISGIINYPDGWSNCRTIVGL